MSGNVTGVGLIPVYTFNTESDAEKTFYDFLNALYNGNAESYTNEDIIGIFEAIQKAYPNLSAQDSLYKIMDPNNPDSSIHLSDNSYSVADMLVTFIALRLYKQHNGDWTKVTADLKTLFDNLGTTSKNPFIQNMIDDYNELKDTDLVDPTDPSSITNGEEAFQMMGHDLGVLDENGNLPDDPEVAQDYIDNITDNYLQSSNFKDWYTAIFWPDYLGQVYTEYGYNPDGSRTDTSNTGAMYQKSWEFVIDCGNRLNLQMGNSQETYDIESEASQLITQVMNYLNSVSPTTDPDTGKSTYNFDASQLLPLLKALNLLAGGNYDDDNLNLNARFGELYTTILNTLDPLFKAQLTDADGKPTGNTLLEALENGEADNYAEANNILNGTALDNTKCLTDALNSALGILGSQSSTLNTQMSMLTNRLEQYWGLAKDLFQANIDVIKHFTDAQIRG